MSQEGSKMLMGLIDSGDKGFAEFMDYQLQEEMFKGDEKDLFLFVKKHAMGYAKLPERKTAESWADENATTIPSEDSIPEPPKFYFDKLEHRNLKLGLLRSMKAAEELRQDSPQDSLSALMSSVLDLSTTARRSKLLNFSEDGAKIIHTEFVKAHNNEDIGLRFGWPTFDRMSGGLGGGDLVSIVGRPGLGKTYLALYAMLSAWRQGMTTLFVSMEMKVTPIAQRIAAMATNTSIGELKVGQVSSKQYSGMVSVLKGMKDSQGMWIADGALSATVEDLRMLAQQLKPDLLVVDGGYLLRHPDAQLRRFDRVNSNTEDVKQYLAEGLNIPVVETFQLNRKAADKLKKSASAEVGVEDIAGSDAIGQLSSVVIGLFEEENIETKLKRVVRVMKGRNGEQGEFTINWRFGGFGAPQEGEVKPKFNKAGKKISEGDIDVSNIMNFTEIVPEDVSTEMKFM